MTDIDYTPEPGSPADRVLELLCRNPEEDYTSSDLALKFQIPKGDWNDLLISAVANGLVHYTKARGKDGYAYTWSAGANLPAWAAKRKGTAAPSTWAAPAPAAGTSKRGGSRPYLAPIDPSTLKVEKGGQIARYAGPGGASKWDPIFALLTEPNTSVVVPIAYKGTLMGYSKKRQKDGRLKGTYSVGNDAKDPTKCRVLRTA